MGEKVTTMKLKVDLQCDKCYKKVKKVLCKFPEIRDMKYDEKQNIVTITVVCCNPEKMRDKIWCKGCGCIQSIEIVEPSTPKTPKTENKSKSEEKKKEPEKKEDSKKSKDPPEPPPVQVEIGIYCVLCCGPCFCGHGRPPPCCDGSQGCGRPPSQHQGCGRPPPCCDGSHGCGRPPPCCDGSHGCGRPRPCYDGCYGRPVCDSCGGGRPCNVSRCDQ